MQAEQSVASDWSETFTALPEVSAPNPPHDLTAAKFGSRQHSLKIRPHFHCFCAISGWSGSSKAAKVEAPEIGARPKFATQRRTPIIVMLTHLNKLVRESFVKDSVDFCASWQLACVDRSPSSLNELLEWIVESLDHPEETVESNIEVSKLITSFRSYKMYQRRWHPG